MGIERHPIFPQNDGDDNKSGAKSGTQGDETDDEGAADLWASSEAWPRLSAERRQLVMLAAGLVPAEV